jgi:hypothetical protein
VDVSALLHFLHRARVSAGDIGVARAKGVADKWGFENALTVNSDPSGFKRITIKLPMSLYREVLRISGGKLSDWISAKLEEVVREEKLKLLLHSLPENISKPLLEKTKGDEKKAVEIMVRTLSNALEEEEEEEAVQETIAFSLKQESALEKKGKERSTG